MVLIEIVYLPVDASISSCAKKTLCGRIVAAA